MRVKYISHAILSGTIYRLCLTSSRKKVSFDADERLSKDQEIPPVVPSQ